MFALAGGQQSVAQGLQEAPEVLSQHGAMSPAGGLASTSSVSQASSDPGSHLPQPALPGTCGFRGTPLSDPLRLP